MKILKGMYGECRFCDNMDPKYGLPSLEEKSWDLCLTDPPYGEGVQHKDGRIGGGNLAKTTIFKQTNDEKFNIKQFKEIERISNFQILFGGNFYEFLPFSKSWIIWDKKKKNGWHNDFADGEMAWTNYEKSLKIFRYRWMGCMREGNEKRTHPFQKPIALWKWIIDLYKPKTILECFAGSGSLIEVCESLGIPWLGYEIMEEYAPDIEKRIQRGIKKKAQQSLEVFL